MTVTYETSLRLKEAGINVATSKYWCEGEDYTTPVAFSMLEARYTKRPVYQLCPAPTFEELWGFLPNNDQITKILEDNTVSCVVKKTPFDQLKRAFVEENITESAASLLLWCKENGYL